MTLSLMAALLCLIRFLLMATAKSSTRAVATPGPVADAAAADGTAAPSSTDRRQPALAAPRQRERPTYPKTADDFLGTVTVVLTNQLVLTHDDECSRCGRRLSALYAIYLADCGRYCSRGCAEGHAEHHAGAAFVACMEASWLTHFRLERAGLLRPKVSDPAGE